MVIVTSNSWSNSTTSTSSASSGTTYYPSSISGSVSGWNLNTKPDPLKEEQEIEVTLLDETKVIMTLKEYFSFIAYNLMVPSDCKDLDEFNEKMMVFRI